MMSTFSQLCLATANIVAVLAVFFHGLVGASSCGRAAEPVANQLVWFGTYTGGPANSEGIYVSRFDAATGKLTPPVLATPAQNASFLSLHPTLPVL